MTLTGLLLLSSGFFLMTLASIPTINHRLKGLFYGWNLVGLALLVNGLVGGPVWTGVGVWVKALETNFGWSRTQITGAFSLTQLEGGIIGPFVGYFIDRLGPQRMVLVGLMVTGLGFIVFSRSTNLAMFYFAYSMIMIGTVAGTWLPFMSVINRWFNRRRGTAMAVAGEGSFLGGFLLLPVMAWAVTPGHLGWSATAMGIGLIFMAVAWPIARAIRTRPEDYGQYPDGDPLSNLQEEEPAADDSPDRDPLDQDQPDFTARQAIRTSTFWLITLGHGLSSMLFATLTVHLVPLLTDQGLSLQTAAYTWSVTMVMGAVFQLIGGYVGDRIPTNLAIFGFATLQAAGFLMAILADSLTMALLVAVLYGAGFGGRSPLMMAIRGEYFGKRAFATLYGISMAPQWGLGLAAPLFAAIMFDAQGNYTLAFLVLGGLGAMSGVCFLLAKKPVLTESPSRLATASIQT